MDIGVESFVAATAGVGRVHAELRRRTHDHHVRINRHPLVAGITRKDFSPTDYFRIIVAYRRYFRWFDDAVAAAAPGAGLAAFWAPRQRSPWLAADMAALGLEPAAGHPLPIDPGVAPRSRQQLVGAFYAIDGSALGGRIIAGHLRRNLGLNVSNGARFFHGYGEQIDLRWAELLELAESLADDETAAAADAAVGVFEGIERALDE